MFFEIMFQLTYIIIDRLIGIDITVVSHLPNTFEGYFCFIACGGNCLMCDDNSKCTTCRNSFYLDGGECQRKLFCFNKHILSILIRVYISAYLLSNVLVLRFFPSVYRY